MAKIKQTELLTKHLAAERLGLSVRRVMELSNDGTFTRHRAFDPETKREAVMFDADEVEAFKATASVTPAPYDPARGLVRLQLDEAARRDEADDAAADDGRPWLTLAGAAEYSGLPASILQAMVETGELAALDVGVRPGGHWRVRRLDLDAIEGKRKGYRSPRI